MNDYLLSIIIPVYNVEKYLYACFDSIKYQLTNDCEVVFVDDGSTDKSGFICDELSNNDSIRVIHKTNGGLSDARNNGIKNSTGKYVMFIDSDDKCAPGKLKNILDILREDESPDVIMGRAVTFSDNDTGNENYNIDSYDKYAHIKDPALAFIQLDRNGRFWFAAWLLIVKRAFLEENDLFFKKGIFHEDELWVPKVFSKASSLRLINDCFYMYRINREGSIVNTNCIKRDFDKISIAKELCYSCASTKAGRILLRRRAAALMFGVLLSVDRYRGTKDAELLVDQVANNKRVMRCGKYYIVYLSCILLNPMRTSRIIACIIK